MAHKVLQEVNESAGTVRTSMTTLENGARTLWRVAFVVLIGYWLLACASTLTPAQIAKQGIPTVVTIRAGNGLGSGFVVRTDGLIATNYHVIREAGRDGIKVVLSDHTELDAIEVLAVNPEHDLAVIRVGAKDLPVVELGSISDVGVGDYVTAIGNPRGLERTVSNGLVSALRTFEDKKNGKLTLLQISAPISPGSSGGPLFNERGEVIGVTSSQIRNDLGQNLNFAISVDNLKTIMLRPEPIAVGQFIEKAAFVAPTVTNDQACTRADLTGCVKRCKDKDGRACALLGDVFYFGDAGQAVNLKLAAGLNRRACDLGEQDSCALFGLMLINGEDGPKDPKTGLQLCTDACNKGSSYACTQLGHQYLAGSTTAKDIAKAERLYTMGCEGGYPAGCRHLGLSQLRSHSQRKAAYSFQRGCDARDAGSCTELGLLLRSGSAGTKDARRAISLFEQACDSGDSVGCAHIGQALLSGESGRTDPQRARNYLEKGCKGGVGWSCDRLRTTAAR